MRLRENTWLWFRQWGWCSPRQELQVCRTDDEFLDIVSVRCLWDKEVGRQMGIQV